MIRLFAVICLALTVGCTTFSKPEEYASGETYKLHRDLAHAIKIGDLNSVNLIRSFLLSKDYLFVFQSENTNSRDSAVDGFLLSQQLTAVYAGKYPEVFGLILGEYYFGGIEEASKLSEKEQISCAVLKLIDMGPNFTNFGGVKGEYKIHEIKIEEDLAKVEATFYKPLMSRGFRIELRRVNIEGVKIWIPVIFLNTWMS
jgi:hypothetical protein